MFYNTFSILLAQVNRQDMVDYLQQQNFMRRRTGDCYSLLAMFLIALLYLLIQHNINGLEVYTMMANHPLYHLNVYHYSKVEKSVLPNVKIFDVDRMNTFVEVLMYLILSK